MATKKTTPTPAITEEAIIKRIQDLTAQRDNYINEANNQVAAFNGAIKALNELLTPSVEEQSK